jgi:tetratricopeptide (TPR) repeat protein
VAIDDTDGRYWYNLGLVRLNLGKFEQAHEAFLRAVEIAPHDEQNQKILQKYFPDEKEAAETK